LPVLEPIVCSPHSAPYYGVEPNAVLGYAFWCPGCKKKHWYPIVGRDSRQVWSFNGNLEKPTFNPSLLHHEHPTLDDEGKTETSPRCHIWIRDGVIEFYSDSTHGVIGHVPMVEIPED
jgi:hypothetical protein